MRITYRTINRHMQYVIVNRYNDLAKLQEQLSTGKRLLRPSDQPTDVANDLQMRTKLKQLSQLERNMEDGLGFMQITDSAMMSMDNLLQRLRELAIQASSDSMSAKERLYIASEVEQLLRQFIALTDTKHKGDYVFAGTQTKIMPFPIDESKASSPIDYQNYDMVYYDASGVPPGTPVQIYEAYDPAQPPTQLIPVQNIIPGTFNLYASGVQYVEGVDYTIDYAAGTITILPGPNAASLSVDVLNGTNPVTSNPYYDYNEFRITFEYVGTGKDVFGQPVDNNGQILREIESGIVTPINITRDELLFDPATNNNILETIIAFGQSLIQNNQSNIVNAITNIDIGFKTLLAAQAKNGSRINRFETTLDRNAVQTIETTRLHSELEDADLAETATKFSVAETVYNAALSSAAKIIQPSLVNFL